MRWRVCACSHRGMWRVNVTRQGYAGRGRDTSGYANGAAAGVLELQD